MRRSFFRTEMRNTRRLTRQANTFTIANLGYGVLGHLLSTLDARPYSECLRQRIFDPLGMRETEPVNNSAILERTVKSYVPFRSDRPYPRFGKLTPAIELIFDFASGSMRRPGGTWGFTRVCSRIADAWEIRVSCRKKASSYW
jgi:CubicO group peptidase (beta-lactamase class C family)